MKRFKYLILLIWVSIVVPAKAQIYLITYDQITNFNGQPDTIRGTLSVDTDNGVSLYEFGKVTVSNQNSRNLDQDGNVSIRVPKKIDTLGSYVRTNLTSGNLDLREKVFGFYCLVKDTTTIVWSSISDTTIDGKKLKKASCTFRGREYTVSFIPEKRVSAGPWKFRGLPGLIVEAKDRTNEVSFKLKDIEKIPGNKIIESFDVPDLTYFQTYEDFRRYRNNLRAQDVLSLKNGKPRNVIYSQIKVNYVEKD